MSPNKQNTNSADLNDLYSEVANVIGEDIGNISADDEQRHFDPVSVLYLLISAAFLSFLKGLFKPVFEKAGEHLSKKVIEGIDGILALKLYKERPKQEDIEEKINHLLDWIEKNPTIKVDKKNGTKELTKFLKKYHIPDKKIQLIAKIMDKQAPKSKK